MGNHIVVVGAGPAGMSAAIAAVERGHRVTVIDEGWRPGGQIYRQASPGLEGPAFVAPSESVRKRELLAQFRSVSERIDYRSETTVYAAFDGPELHIERGGKTGTVRADAVILATGAREKMVPFPGWTLPGVMGAGGAQSMLKSQLVLPGQRAVVAGSGPLPLVVASQLSRAGAELSAFAPLRSIWSMARHPWALWQGREPVMEGLGYMASLRRTNTARLTGYVPTRADGTEKLEAVTLARLDDRGAVVPGTEVTFDCDLLGVNYGFVANSELAAMFGAKMHFDDDVGGWLPEVDEGGRTTANSVYACGDGVALRGAFVAQAEGVVVGTAVAADLAGQPPGETDKGLGAASARRARHIRFQRALREMLALPSGLWALADGETVVCRCERVTAGEIQAAFEQGHVSVNAVKRNTRCGMGWCSGRGCLHAVMAMAEAHTGSPTEDMVTARPLARPVTLSALAARESS